jgi:hypothetical protein
MTTVIGAWPRLIDTRTHAGWRQTSELTLANHLEISAIGDAAKLTCGARGAGHRGGD